MSAAADQSNFPTMIIPRGTEIKLNNHGQLSIKTPGNLVIQNSGNYSEIESTNGSIRIEENVAVDRALQTPLEARVESRRHLRLNSRSISASFSSM